MTENPPPLDYRSPTPTDRPKFNQWWKVILRILAGAFAGGLATVLGVIILGQSNIPILGMLPFATLFTVAMIISIRYRRYGYTSGIIIAPFLTAAIVILLLLWTCGHSRGI